MDLQAKDGEFTVVSTAALDSLKRMVEELERDAARYRWLRQNNDDLWHSYCSESDETLNDFDAAIDKVMKHE
jgi:hypothetical protein